jgi:hypothetical protein
MRIPVPTLFAAGIRTLLVAGAVLSPGSKGRAAELAVPRVSFLNFVCEDNSYRSTQAAAELTSAVQAMLSSETRVQWVERVELEKIEAEQHLTGLGLIDRSEAIQQGRLANADWAVMGRISTNRLAGREFSLEIVDLQTADLLASTSFIGPPSPAPYFRSDSTQVTTATGLLRELVGEALANRRRIEASRTLALMYITHSGTVPGVENLENDLIHALNSSPPGEVPIHVVQMRRLEQASGEAQLTLSGLVRKSGSRDRIADVFAWGTCSTRETRSFVERSRERVVEPVTDLVMNLWDGGGERIELRVSVTNLLSSDELVRPMIAKITNWIAGGARPAGAENEGGRVSEELTRQAIELMRPPPFLSLHTMDGQARWLGAVKILETARFLDSGSQLANELWTRVRWGSAAGRLCDNEFFFARRRADAWKNHVAQFGHLSVITNEPFGWWTTNSIDTEYLLSAWRPFEMLRFGQGNQAQWGVPRDAGGKELREWQRRFGTEFYARLLGLPVEFTRRNLQPEYLYWAFAMNGDEMLFPDPAFRQQIWERLWPGLLELARLTPVEFDLAYRPGFQRHFEVVGHPGRGDELIAQLNGVGHPEPQTRPPRPVVLPRAATFFPDQPPPSP